MIDGHVYVVRTAITKPPKDKIVLCICGAENLCFWFNTLTRSHGIGQLACSGNEHPCLTHACHLDLSRVTTFLPTEIAAAQDRGKISKVFARQIIETLQAGVRTLTPRHIAMAIETLSAI